MDESKQTYEEKSAKLDEILTRLDNSETPIDLLAADVVEGIKLIREMNETLRGVEMQVKDAFKELDGIEKERDGA